jgi:sarcosine oxidase subunit gamma
VAETLNRDPACVESSCAGQFGALTPHAGITFTAHTALTLIDLRGDPRDAAFLASAHTALGAALPLKPNTTVAAKDCEILWLGPDEWLLMSSDLAPLSDRLPIARGFLTDVSHGRAGWRISGPRTLDLLAKGCSLDLHPRAFRAGDCAQTALAHAGVLLHRRGTESFDIYCARSYAQHLWHWLTGAAAEFGYEVVAPVGA